MNAPATARVEPLASTVVRSDRVSGPAPTPIVARIAVLGASGYSGQEFVRLALGHPGVALAALVSRDAAGAAGASLFLGLESGATLPAPIKPAELSAALSAGTFDTLVSALPHGVLRTLFAQQPALADTPRIIDLSSDHRDGLDGYVYGLPEAFRAEIAGARRIANPGCYATAAALALLPAARAQWLAGTVTVSALSGVTGAGRAAQLHTSFAEVDGGAAFYKVGETHAHVPEMTRMLQRAGADVTLAFAPQLVPMSRGILLTANAPLRAAMTPDAARSAYAAHWAGETFVRVLPAGEWPQTRIVQHSNRCDLAVTTVHGGHTLLVTAALDNLVKGAAGQALQNLNLLTGWPEVTGLPMHGRPW